MDNRFEWNGGVSSAKRKKERHTFRPVEFFGHAVDIAPGELFVPERGFKVLNYMPARSELQPAPSSMPIYSIAVEQARAFDLFTDLLEPLGEELSVVLESTHDSTVSNRSRDYWSVGHDAISLQSALVDYEDLLTKDGCTGLSILDENQHCEVMYTEDKSLHCYGTPGIMGKFQRILHRHNVLHRPEMKMLFDQVAHIHRTTVEYCDRFHELVERVGALSA